MPCTGARQPGVDRWWHRLSGRTRMRHPAPPEAGADMITPTMSPSKSSKS
ncbi:hypothetical protein [Streptomyces celluloflavus]